MRVGRNALVGGLLVQCLLILSAIAPAVAAPEPQKLRIVFIAYSNPNQLIEDVGPVIDYLEGRLHVEVEHFVATDYAGVVEALRNGTADAGFMGPLQYVMAHHFSGAYPIVGEVYGKSPSYFSRIFVRKDSGIERLEQLKGKTIAFVDPISSSGYMYPLDIFTTAGLIRTKEDADNYFKKIYFAGGDEQAIRAVFNKFVDAAGIGQYAYSLLRAEERDQITPIADSKPLPSHCVVVRQGLARGRVKALQEALLALNDGPDRGLLKNLYSVDGYVPVTHETYAEVEQVARRYGFIRE
jgi:phosphonate transport system substrate-binding protein